MKILILGKGFIGTRLHSYLQSEDIHSTVFSKAELNYTSPFRLGKYLRRHHPDYVINASGYTGRPNVDACEDDKENCWYYNVAIPNRISEACQKTHSKLIHISSGCIYTGYEKEYTEKDPPNFGLFDNDSSWYSKTKHAAELELQDKNAYIFRIRMPFTKDYTPRNIFNKILKYDNLIAYQNSMTGIEDFCSFIVQFIRKDDIKPGIFNVVNPGGLDIKQITTIMKKYSWYNPNWKFVDIKELNMKANRSNCILSCKKIENLGLGLPEAIESVENCISLMPTHYDE
jgi:dTDP-4-dehydrorhamnose reductase